jgi:hypothetical protein
MITRQRRSRTVIRYDRGGAAHQVGAPRELEQSDHWKRERDAEHDLADHEPIRRTYAQGSFHRVEHLADLGRETGEIEGLHDQLYARIEAALMDDRILRITRREKDFQIASELSSFICYLSAIERAR